jgi:hypothetical protein
MTRALALLAVLIPTVAWAQPEVEPPPHADAPEPEAAPPAEPAPVDDVPAPATEPPEARGEEAEAETPGDDTPLEISGYIQPQVGLTYRPDGLPRDRTDYGVTAVTAGLEFTGGHGQWDYDVLFLIEAALGDEGEAGELSPSSPAVLVERATLGYAIWPELRVDLGMIRIPFTVQELSPNTQLLFPTRSGPNTVFLSGADLGLVTSLDLGSGFFKAQLGVFNGNAHLASEESTDKGLLYAARVDCMPFGDFEFAEGDPKAGPLRLGVGLGAIYRGTSAYDEQGYFGQSVRDLRASASIRLAVRGFYLQAEVLRRQRTDNLSSRPDVTTGAYAQTSYHLPLAWPVGLAPMARVGWAREDEGFAPRTTEWLEAGVTIYPQPELEAPERLKIIVQYLGEFRVTEGEDAHGFLIQGQKLF